MSPYRTAERPVERVRPRRALLCRLGRHAWKPTESCPHSRPCVCEFAGFWPETFRCTGCGLLGVRRKHVDESCDFAREVVMAVTQTWIDQRWHP